MVYLAMMSFVETIWHRILERLVNWKGCEIRGRGWFYVSTFFIRGEESRENSQW